MQKEINKDVTSTVLALGLGIGVLWLIYKLFSNSESEVRDKRIFISFAKEDELYRDFLVDQSVEHRSPFDFVDMSVKKPWKERVWKDKCRERIRKCDGMIVLLSKKIWHSSGARWEINCAKEEGVKVIGMHIQKNNKGAVPPELKGMQIIDWTWGNLKEIMKSI